MKMLFAGDFCPIGRTEHMSLEGRSRDVFGNVIEKLNDKDLSVVNLECPLTRRNVPIRKVGPSLKADPATVDCLREGNFDVASLANNHIIDYGSQSIKETISLLESKGIHHVGAGSTLKEAQKPLYLSRLGKQVAFLSFAERGFNWAERDRAGVWALDPLVNIGEIQQAKAEADIVVVMVHGGNEHNPFPSPRLIRIYRAFVDAGAAAVVGTHPHVPEGYENYHGAPIFYSLGNFVFDFFKKEQKDFLWSKSYLAQLDFEGNKVHKVEIVPFMSLTTGKLALLRCEESEEFKKYIDFLSSLLNNPDEMQRSWEAWCAWKGPEMLLSLSTIFPFAFLNRIIPQDNFGVTGRLLMAKHIITRDAHREILITLMDLMTRGEIKRARSRIPFLKEIRKGKIPARARRKLEEGKDGALD